ncbi:MAG: hypothetical protein SVX38_06285 [Chloroflexota bacterium]|nr:hypothetical protein [Chloroflexota bacterium]
MTEASTALRTTSDFRRARRRASQEDLRCLLSRLPANLLPFEVVRQNLSLTNYVYRGLHSVPLDSIVGSVGRYHDFNRHFWPRQDALRDRWARVAHLMVWGSGLPPIQLYLVDEVYFVKDGNHRVSVSRYLDTPAIESFVWEFNSRVPLTLNTRLEDLPLKEELVSFLKHTDLDRTRPQQEVVFTILGSCRALEEHISAHRYWLENLNGSEVPLAKAVGSWYDLVYTPMVEIIRERNLLSYFPQRTESDLYLSTLNHHHYLVNSLERPVSLDQTIENYVEHFSPQLRYRVPRLLRYWLRGERRPPVPAPSAVTTPANGDAS